MKFLKNIAAVCCIALTATAFTACSDSNNEPEKPGTKVTIATEVITRASHLNELTAGMEMNVYVKKSGSINAEDLVSGVKATRGTDGIWKLDPEIYIDGVKQKVAYFFGAYPYNAAATDPTKFPVDLNQQQDVLYSGTVAAASTQTTTARLKMKHALAMLCFNFDASSYAGAGKVTQIKVGGEGIATKGTLDISKGEFKATENGTITAKADANIKTKGANPNIWVSAFQTTAQPATLTVTIDGKEFTAQFPDVTIENEYQYGFHLILTDNGLVFRPGDVTRVSLNEGIDDLESPLGYGLMRITTTASELHFPIFSGDNVFGTAKSGSDMANYSMGGSIKLSGSGSKTVNLETWNSTGFEVADIEGLEEIDLSNY